MNENDTVVNENDVKIECVFESGKGRNERKGVKKDGNKSDLMCF